MKLLLFFLIFSFETLAARNPPTWKFAYHAGKAETNYIETQPTLAFTYKNIHQKSSFQEFHWTYFLMPPFIDITLAAQHTGLQYDEPEDPAVQLPHGRSDGRGLRLRQGVRLPRSPRGQARHRRGAHRLAGVVAG